MLFRQSNIESPFTLKQEADYSTKEFPKKFVPPSFFVIEGVMSINNSQRI